MCANTDNELIFFLKTAFNIFYILHPYNKHLDIFFYTETNFARHSFISTHDLMKIKSLHSFQRTITIWEKNKSKVRRRKWRKQTIFKSNNAIDKLSNYTQKNRESKTKRKCYWGKSHFILYSRYHVLYKETKSLSF